MKIFFVFAAFLLVATSSFSHNFSNPDQTKLFNMLNNKEAIYYPTAELLVIGKGYNGKAGVSMSYAGLRVILYPTGMVSLFQITNYSSVNLSITFKEIREVLTAFKHEKGDEYFEGLVVPGVAPSNSMIVNMPPMPRHETPHFVSQPESAFFVQETINAENKHCKFTLQRGTKDGKEYSKLSFSPKVSFRLIRKAYSNIYDYQMPGSLISHGIPGKIDNLGFVIEQFEITEENLRLLANQG